MSTAQSTSLPRRNVPPESPSMQGGIQVRQPSPERTNVGQSERWLSVAAGTAMVASGVARGKLSGIALGLLGGSLIYRGFSGHCYAYEALGVDTHQDQRHAVEAQAGVRVEKATNINKPAEELYSAWRDVEQLPKFMRHLKRVERIDDQRSRWTAEGPLGKSVSWEAEVFNENPPEMIAWRSLPGGDIDTAGSIHFESLPNGRGTRVSVSIKYDPPGGKLGDTVASLLGQGLEQQIDEDLRRFKSEMEAGEVPSIHGQPTGR